MYADVVAQVRRASNASMYPMRAHRGDFTGQLRNPAVVEAAARKELDYFNVKGLGHKCEKPDCHATTGKAPIIVWWVGANNGDDDARTRGVVLWRVRFAENNQTPCLRPRHHLTVCAQFCLWWQQRLKAQSNMNTAQETAIEWKWAWSIPRAYFCAERIQTPRRLWSCQMWNSDLERCAGDFDVVSAAQGAPANGWQSTLVRGIGFTVGNAQRMPLSLPIQEPNVFRTRWRHRYVWLTEALGLVQGTARKKFELTKAQRIWPGNADDNKAAVLNRLARRARMGLEYGADSRHAEKLLSGLGLDDGVTQVGASVVKGTQGQLKTDQVLDPR